MLSGAPAKLIHEWMAYYDLEPFGEVRADIRSAIVCQTIAASLELKKRGGGKFKLEDFMPEFGQNNPKPPSHYSPKAAEAILRKRYGNNRKSGGKPHGPNRGL